MRTCRTARPLTRRLNEEPRTTRLSKMGDDQPSQPINRGGGSGTSRPRDTTITSPGHSCWSTGDASSISTSPRIGAGTSTATLNSCLMPLQDSADIDSPGHAPRSGGAVFAQHDAFLLAFTHPVLPQSASHGPAPSHVTRVPTPRLSCPLIPSTHSSQCALPGCTALDAAIHCTSLNRTTSGGMTPFSIDQTSRSCSEWQQQCVQHSIADAHPHPHDSHG